MGFKDILGKVVIGAANVAVDILVDSANSAAKKQGKPTMDRPVKFEYKGSSNGSGSKSRRTDEDLARNTTGLDKRARDYSVKRGVPLKAAVNSAPSQEGVYVICFGGQVMKCGRAAYGQGLKWRFTQYYNLNYDNRARNKDYWSVSPENRDRVTVSWQACPVSKCKELEAKLFRKYGKGPWGLRAPSSCNDDTWELLI